MESNITRFGHFSATSWLCYKLLNSFEPLYLLIEKGGVNVNIDPKHRVVVIIKRDAHVKSLLP